MGDFSNWYDWAMPAIPASQAVYSGAKALAGKAGVNLPSASSLANSLEGNPAGLASSLQGLMQTAYTQGNNINKTLQGEKAQSLKYYQPMQQMFGRSYGNAGLMPAKAPGAPGGGTP
jgi:hypothetical protein